MNNLTTHIQNLAGVAASRPASLASLFAVSLLLAPLAAPAQWVAYNDHNRGPNTASNVSTYSITTANTTVGGPLTNFTTGQLTSPNRVGVRVSHVGTLNGASGGSSAPNAGTPAHEIFGGKVDWSASALYFGGPGGQSSSAVTFTFTNLTPGRRYSFRGTGVRGGGYPERWLLTTLAGASNAVAAHRMGAGSPGIVTNGWTPYGNTMRPLTQALLHTGNNLSGDVIGWDDIAPLGDSFSVICSNWTGALPGTSATNSTYAYWLSAIRLEEGAIPVPTIVSEPQEVNVCLGLSAALSVEAICQPPLFYQWRKDGVDLATATNQTFAIPVAVNSDAGGYSVVLTGPAGSVTSRVAAVVVDSVPVSFTSELAGQTVILGTPATFVLPLAANASQPVTCQWFKNSESNTVSGTAISGATNSVLALSNAQASDVAFYYVVAGNCVNTVTSSVASLGVSYLPLSILAQPQDTNVLVGGLARLSITVTGSIPSFQWFKEATAIPDATNATLVLTNLQVRDSGLYHVVVSNLVGTVVSREASVVVNLPPYPLVSLTNHVWRYNQDAVDLGTSWHASDYPAETNWPSGRGVFAYENNAVVNALTNTVLRLSNSAGVYIRTFYFRTTFVLSNDPRLFTLLTSNLIDDGVVCYLNGVEAYRWNMPQGTITWNTLAPTANPLGEGVFFVTNVPSQFLLRGTNTLAVEVHQAGTASADVVFGLAAFANSIPPSFLQITNEPSEVVVTEPTPATLSVGVAGAPTFAQWFKRDAQGQPVPIPGATETSYRIPFTIHGADDGDYFVTVTNLISEVTSHDIHLTVLASTNPPAILDADGTRDARQILLSFDKALFLDTNEPLPTLTNPANYTVTNTLGEVLVVTSALFTNWTNVLLTTAAPRLPDRNYLVTVGSARDITSHHSLATNLAAPVSFVLPIIGLEDFYEFIQPVPGLDPVEEFDSGAWRQSGYDPATSAAGWFFPAFSAFCLGESGSPVNCGTELTQGLLASYFRRPFHFEGSSAGASFQLRHLVNDGAVFYLDGVEVLRVNMPDGPVALTTLARGNLWPPAVIAATNFTAVSPAYGLHLLAAELHPYVGVATELTFAAEVQARVDSIASGPVFITTPPRDLAVNEGGAASFTFKGVGGRTFQWKSNGVALAGADGPSYTLPHAPLTADGTRFSVVVTGESNEVESSAATLTVLPDTQPPRLVSAYLTAPDTITVAFSEPLAPGTATNLSNFAITNALGPDLNITGVSFDGGSNVTLRVAPPAGGSYTVVVSGVKDASMAANNIIANSRVTVGVQNLPLVSIDAATTWQYHDDNVDLTAGNTDYSWRTNYALEGGWQTGAAVFAAKLGVTNPADIPSPEPVRTLVNLTDQQSGGSSIVTLYFRTRFVAPVFGPGASMAVRHIVEDGAAFYLNGQLLYALGVNTPTTFYALANRTVGDPAYEGPFNVPATNLFPGVNQLAVEAKNVSTTSSDIAFATWLYLTIPSVVLTPGGLTNPPPSPALLSVARPDPDHVQLWWSSPAAWTLQFADELTPTGAAWMTLTNPPNPFTVPATNAARFYRLKF
ncbi:MAG: Ig-like domain-containing protein [Verrucomicrobia bacterium]|nr:Ig-like domain-containing protein [Verrucomicrobiota bacterium]